MRSTWSGLAGLLAPSCAAVLLLLGADSRVAQAAVSETEISSDSVLDLLERTDGGEYARYSIRLTIRDGACTLSTDKDGVQTTAPAPLEDCLGAWRVVLQAGLETLTDASPAKAPPDQSRFKVGFRVLETSGGFSAYGVDSLEDGRYKRIVRAILDFAATQAARAR
jgi:hypothetical protein